jgi:hypothetical protein
MRLPPHHRLGAGLFGALVVGALLAPVAATADDAGPLGCKEPLTVVSWDGASDAGDQRAVAITSQQFDSGVDGWSSVSWEAAEDTTLTAVTALQIDGTASPLEPTPGGTATGVASLSFCGTRTPPVPAPTEPRDTATRDSAPSRPAPRSSAPGVRRPSGTATSTSSNATPAPWAQTPGTPGPAVTGPRVPTDPTDELPPEVDIEPPEAQTDTSTRFNDRSTGPGDRSTGPDDERDEEVEVMGIQLVRDAEPAGSGPIGAVGALLAVLGLLATVGGLLWSRRS